MRSRGLTHPALIERFKLGFANRTVTQTTDFAYGSDNLRYKQRSGDVAQTIYIGQHYTEQTLANGTTQQRVYIDDVAIDITSISREGKHNRIQSLHTDRLGSTVGVFNTSGYLHESRSYDAFGAPRGSLNSDRFNAILGSTVSPRGFTQHEHVDGAQLIHMNGRVYDYHLGRFLSVDPFIQGGGNSQGVNPYSYILNNPLAGTDPSGYVAITGLDRWSGMPDPMGYGDNCPFCVNTGDDKEGQDNGAEAGGQASLNITITADNIGGQGDFDAITQEQYSHYEISSETGLVPVEMVEVEESWLSTMSKSIGEIADGVTNSITDAFTGHNHTHDYIVSQSIETLMSEHLTQGMNEVELRKHIARVVSITKALPQDLRVIGTLSDETLECLNKLTREKTEVWSVMVREFADKLKIKLM